MATHHPRLALSGVVVKIVDLVEPKLNRAVGVKVFVGTGCDVNILADAAKKART